MELEQTCILEQNCILCVTCVEFCSLVFTMPTGAGVRAWLLPCVTRRCRAARGGMRLLHTQLLHRAAVFRAVALLQ